jgi:hypothetical protein
MRWQQRATGIIAHPKQVETRPIVFQAPSFPSQQGLQRFLGRQGVVGGAHSRVDEERRALPIEMGIIQHVPQFPSDPQFHHLP